MKTKKTKKLIFLSILFVCIVFLMPLSVYAQDKEPESKITPIEPTLQIDIPTVQFSKIQTDDGYITVPHLAQYIAGIFKYAVSIISIIAIIMIMVGGLKWLTAGGAADRVKSAQETITGAVLGLILALGSYTVLYVINPDLVSFDNLRIQLIDRQAYPALDYSEESYLSSSEGALDDSNLVKIKGDNMMSRVSSNAKAIAPLVERFQKVAVALKAKNCIIASASGARPNTRQLQITKKSCTWSDKYKTYVRCKPAVGIWGSTNKDGTPKSSTCKYTDKNTPLGRCSLTGFTHEKAIDAFAVELSTKKSSKGAARCYGGKGCMQERCQKELIDAMNKAGACVLLGRKKDPSSGVFEPWHFELASGKNSAYCYTNAIQIFNSL